MFSKEIKEDKNFIFDVPLIKNFNYYRRRILLPFYDIYMKILLNIYNWKNQKNIKGKKYYLTICAIFKNEAKNMKEWLEYHLLIGVEHFYLYNNFSNDNFLEILKPYIEKGIVTLREWPVEQGQLSAYQDCYEKDKNYAQWICFLDLDEFICPYKDNNIRELLKRYRKYPSVVIYWKMFGTSGKIKRTKELVIEEFYISFGKLFTLGKCFFNTDFKMKKHKVHFIDAEIKIFNKNIVVRSINENRKFIKYNIHRKNREGFTAQINHYFSKTYDEYIENKMKRGDVLFKISPYTLQHFYNYEMKNISCDYKIFRFIIALKNRWK